MSSKQKVIQANPTAKLRRGACGHGVYVYYIKDADGNATETFDRPKLAWDEYHSKYC